MIHVKQSTEYYINERAITFAENDLDNVNRIAVSVAGGTVIMVHLSGLIDFAADGNYEKWTLKGYPTRVSTNSAYYVYARLERESAAGLIVFSTNLYNAEGATITSDGTVTAEPSGDYYYIKIGELTATDGSTKREMTYDSGLLGTKKAESTSGLDEMFELDKVSTPWLIKVKQMFYEFSVKKAITLLGDFIFGGRTLTGVAASDDADKLATPLDSDIATAAYVQAHGDSSYLSKTGDDTAQGIITFLKGLIAEGKIDAKGGIDVGEAIDSMLAGKGIVMTDDGRIQTDRLEVRGSMTVMELIFNRLSAMESNYGFSESGSIESVEQQEDGTYNLYLRKRFDGDFTALAVNDVVYGQVNDLSKGGHEYYTSWLRVLNVDTSANMVNALLYPNEEVPGGVNYPPVEMMNLIHRGNPVDEDRQAYWYLSSAEKCICMLDGVTKPILEESNYALIAGKLKELSIFDNLPINYRHTYLYVRGVIMQDRLTVDYAGNPVATLNDRGNWSADVAAGSEPYQNTATVVDTVWHYGCRWKCLVSGTTDEPRYASTGWAMIEGNPNFSIEIDSTNGFQFDITEIGIKDADGNYPVFTTLFVTGWMYNRDVTEHLLDADVQWTRDTGDVTEDNAWAVKRADAGLSLTLTVDDLGVGYPYLRNCAFKATVLLRDGEGVTAEDEINF